jgi:hypothetical protein
VSRGDHTGLLIFIGVGVVVWLLYRHTIWQAAKVEEQAVRKSVIIASAKKEILEKEFQQKRSEEWKKLTQRELELDKKESFVNRLTEAFSNNFIAGRKWLASFIAEADSAEREASARYLKTKKHPAHSAAEKVRQANYERRQAIEQLKFLQYQLATYKEYFPILEEYEEVILNERSDFRAADFSTMENVDRVLTLVSDEEYKSLGSAERNQLALERYVKRSKANWEIGRLYERYIGYTYEIDGWDVEFHGAQKGFEDLGRDLVCRKNGITHIVQAKCWSKEKLIREKHIFQLFGTTLLYELENGVLSGTVKSIFVATTNLSDVAQVAARKLGMEVRKVPLSSDYPMIKCNISSATDEKIYHLPFDQQYDNIKIDRPGECYVKTAAEAEKLGFRRAFRYRGGSEGN